MFGVCASACASEYVYAFVEIKWRFAIWFYCFDDDNDDDDTQMHNR